MKKTVFVFAIAFILMFCACAQAAEIQLYVSVSNSQGELVLAYEKVTVTDADADGALTLNDALIAAHTQAHTDGAAAYASEKTEYGLSLVKLWGEDNGGSFGYCLNHGSAWSLLDPVAEDDHVKAYAYTDLVMWSDTYAFFAADAITAKTGEAVEITLNAAGYDADWNPVTISVAGAVITVNGEATAFVTDANGMAAVSFEAAGEYVISAYADNMTLVAPVCIVTVE